MFKRLSCFIEKYNILCDRQFGFREKHSTTHATLLIADRIQQAIEDGQYSCGIFLDFSKAFDTVNHNILLNKLNHYGYVVQQKSGSFPTFPTENSMFQ